MMVCTDFLKGMARTSFKSSATTMGKGNPMSIFKTAILKVFQNAGQNMGRENIFSKFCQPSQGEP